MRPHQLSTSAPTKCPVQIPLQDLVLEEGHTEHHVVTFNFFDDLLIFPNGPGVTIAVLKPNFPTPNRHGQEFGWPNSTRLELLESVRDAAVPQLSPQANPVCQEFGGRMGASRVGIGVMQGTNFLTSELQEMACVASQLRQ